MPPMKYSAIYRCPNGVNKLKLRIRIKNEENSEEISKIFKWQVKHFSKSEKEFFSEERNCVTELQKSYHNDIINLTNECDFIYSYIEGDHYLPENELPDIPQLKTTPKVPLSFDPFDLKDSLESSLKNPVGKKEIQSMYIMADLGDYLSNIWIKEEQVLCSLKYNKKRKILQIFPDFTTTEPYLLKSKNDNIRVYQYFIENVSDPIPEDVLQKEQMLLKKVKNYKLSMKNQLLPNFQAPPKNKIKVFIFFEILSAGNFENDTFFVQYFVHLPPNWHCEGCTEGMTSICRSKNNYANFGHDFDLIFDYELQNVSNKTITEPPCLYFEIVSKDYWDRYRTEGLTYKVLPIAQPGSHVECLHCWRFGGRELRRFFIGDYGNYTDVTSVGIPREFEGKTLNKIALKTVSTGTLNIRYNIVCQSQALMENYNENFQQERHIFDKLNSSNLVKSVEQVLMDFRKARKNMLKARGDL